MITFANILVFKIMLGNCSILKTSRYSCGSGWGGSGNHNSLKI